MNKNSFVPWFDYLHDVDWNDSTLMCAEHNDLAHEFLHLAALFNHDLRDILAEHQ
jgi:hypothetical protein